MLSNLECPLTCLSYLNVKRMKAICCPVKYSAAENTYSTSFISLCIAFAASNWSTLLPVLLSLKEWNHEIRLFELSEKTVLFFLSFEGSFLCQRSLAIDIEMKMWRIKIIYSVIILGFGLIFHVKWRHFKYEFFTHFFFKITQRLIFVDGYKLTQ